MTKKTKINSDPDAPTEDVGEFFAEVFGEPNQEPEEIEMRPVPEEMAAHPRDA